MSATDQCGHTLEVSVDEAYAAAAASASKAIMGHPVLRHEFPGGDLWLVSFDMADKGEPDRAGTDRFHALIQDTGSGRLSEARGVLGEPPAVTVTPVAHQRAPGEEELAWAVNAAAADAETSPLLTAEGSQVYRPMPPFVNVIAPDGSVDRVVMVGIRSTASEGPSGPQAGEAQPRHRIVGVRTSDGAVVPDPTGVPQPSSADCGAPLGQGCASTSGPARVRVRVGDGDRVLWELLVVRPAASSGTNGSGVELRQVDYLGQRVLARAHAPILNVHHGDDGRGGHEEGEGEQGTGEGCGPAYRAWAHEESCFVAEGPDVAPGFRRCTSPPATVLDTGADGGDFRGVAFWLEGGELVIVSQLQAGWYRYVSEWRLLADGTIRPRFGFAAAANPCTCRPHAHHVYWRFDFDVLGYANNLVQEHNDPPVIGTSNWHTTRYEVRRPRDRGANRFWRVRNVRSSQGYSLVPGADDGEADDYGAGDVWVLRYHDPELDDGQGFTTDPALSRADLDRFVTGESVQRQDVVLWYAAHCRQDPAPAGEAGSGADDDGGGHRVGPDLVPTHWGDIPSREGIGPVEPPPRPS